MEEIACELCGGTAAVRCEPDAAFLCWSCDARVHTANFLVARHVRRPLLAECGAATPGDDGDLESESCCSSTRRDSASSGASSGESGGGGISSRKTLHFHRRDLGADAEGSVLSWCRRLGFGDCSTALQAFRVGDRRMRAAPRRAVAAAAAWFVAGKAGNATALRRLEVCSGVPAKVILATEKRLSRAVRRCHVGDDAEGWAESVAPACSLSS